MIKAKAVLSLMFFCLMIFGGIVILGIKNSPKERKQLPVPVATPIPRPFDLDELKGRLATNGKVLIVCSKDQKFAVVVFLDTLVTSPSENGCAQNQ